MSEDSLVTEVCALTLPPHLETSRCHCALLGLPAISNIQLISMCLQVSPFGIGMAHRQNIEDP